MDNRIHTQLKTQAKEADVNSVGASVAYSVTCGKATGWQANTQTKTKVSAVDYHKYLNKKLAMKDINGLGIFFSDENPCSCNHVSNSTC